MYFFLPVRIILMVRDLIIILPFLSTQLRQVILRVEAISCSSGIVLLTVKGMNHVLFGSQILRYFCPKLRLFT